MASPTPEVRLERLRPAEIAAALARAPIAWVALGALEFHAPHLPNGTDGFTGHGLVVRAAERVGGVVLPWSYMTMGTLALPWSFRFAPSLVEAVLRETLRQLPAQGVRLAVVHTGHAPLDLIHLIKRVCAEVAAEGSGMQAYGLCYLELNATLGTGLGTDWPVAVDHGAAMETSWIGALEPGLLDLDALPLDPAATTTGVYGANPRFTADSSRGAAQIEAAATLLGDRARAVLAGEDLDTYADLRGFVDRYWPERLMLAGRAGTAGAAAILATNPGPVSRYLTSVRLTLDGAEVRAQDLLLRNPTVGEAGVAVSADTLGPERGFYVRRNQTAEVLLPMAMEAGEHDVELRLGLAGVSEALFTQRVAFT